MGLREFVTTGRWSRPKVVNSRKVNVENILKNQLQKSARTPVYDEQGYSWQRDKKKLMEPKVDQRYLEYLALNYSHLASVIDRLASQTTREGWVLEPRVDNPSEDQKEFLKNLLNDPTSGEADITGIELLKAIVRDIEIFDDAWVSIVYDYLKDEFGGIMGRKIKQLWVEDPKKMRFKTDRYGRFQMEEKFCPQCRNEGGGMACKNCGTQLVPIAYVHLDTVGDKQKEIPFARDEIIHFNKHASAARLYGESPIVGLAKKIETGLAIENYQNKLFRLERAPKGILNIPGFDFEGLSEFTEYMQEQTAANPNYVPIVSTEGRRADEIQYIHMMSGNAENKMLAYIDRINQDINAAYGLMPLAVADFRDTAGLYSEREQITMIDRTLHDTQSTLELGFFEPLCRLCNITDWRVEMTVDGDRQENQRLRNLQIKGDVMAGFAEMGIQIGIDADERLIFPHNMDDWAGPERNTSTQWVPRETNYRQPKRQKKDKAEAVPIEGAEAVRRGEPGTPGGAGDGVPKP